MLIDNTHQGVAASTLSASILPDHEFEDVRLLAFGSLTAVRLTIQGLHRKNYAEPNDWSKPISTGRPNEVMAILTRRVRVD